MFFSFIFLFLSLGAYNRSLDICIEYLHLDRRYARMVGRIITMSLDARQFTKNCLFKFIAVRGNGRLVGGGGGGALRRRKRLEKERKIPSRSSCYLGIKSYSSNHKPIEPDQRKMCLIYDVTLIENEVNTNKNAGNFAGVFKFDTKY